MAAALSIGVPKCLLFPPRMDGKPGELKISLPEERELTGFSAFVVVL